MKIFHIGICVYKDPIWLAAALMRVGDCIECLPETPDDAIIAAAPFAEMPMLDESYE